VPKLNRDFMADFYTDSVRGLSGLWTFTMNWGQWGHEHTYSPALGLTECSFSWCTYQSIFAFYIYL